MHESYSGSTFNTLNVAAAGIGTVMLEAVELDLDEWISLVEVSFCSCRCRCCLAVCCFSLPALNSALVSVLGFLNSHLAVFRPTRRKHASC